MKKIFYILASAIVALGAVACENDVMDNIATENEGLSFVATIDNSKTDLDDLKTIWSDDDVITIEGFEFTHQGEGKFTCTNSEVGTLKGQSNLVAWYNEDGIDSEAGAAGAQLKAEGAFDAEGNASGFSFAVQNAFLKFTTTETVTLKGAGLFSTGDEVTIKGSGETQYVAINPVSATLSYSVNDVKCKEVTLDFAAKNIYNLGTLEAPVFKVYVIPQPGTTYAKWEQVNLYTWVDGGIGLTWPGEDITANTEIINGYTYNYFEYPAEYIGKTVNVIANNGTAQTEDIQLGVLDTNYYVVYSPIIETQVTTEAPAAGSIEEYVAPENLDPKPDTTTLYLQTTWGWTSWALYAWGGSGSWGTFNSWPGKSKEYDQVIEGVTYKAWDIPASCVGQTGTQVIVTGKENGTTKQTKDTPVTFEQGKDVFVEISSWDGSVGKATMTVINGPY